MRKKLLLAAGLAVTILAATGCGMETSITINPDLTSSTSETIYYNEDDICHGVNLYAIFNEEAAKAKTYKVSSGKKITFKDATSGAKKATLNGKTIKSGKVVKKAGKYTLVITDKAGNKKTVKFTIKKS